MKNVTLVLGPEYDAALLKAIEQAVHELGNPPLKWDWAMGGSQEIETARTRIGNEEIFIEAETHVGLSITGASAAVERFAGLLKKEANRNPIPKT